MPPPPTYKPEDYAVANHPQTIFTIANADPLNGSDTSAKLKDLNELPTYDEAVVISQNVKQSPYG
ncbi:hypothetical protein Bhyg_06591 [Pseudolycoriella hygida]|uniref:Uncharacterized protein n=1 Tax=Pseudolycoriella hygida TaxID=35572 RepID=A0A9Q0N212_9DIPT|nr:hypothetical protein Bhyg_06591 [Pseudolycoriella hygida]